MTNEKTCRCGKTGINELEVYPKEGLVIPELW